MPIEVFDFRRDIRNLYISPAMRGRFLRHEPGEAGPFHSHDIADECFLILQGQCEFTIDGDRAVLSPGQICFTRPGQKHEVRVVGDEPMIMFLVVSPHIEPTHTFWADDGARLPERYGMTTAAEYAAADHSEPVSALAALASAALSQLASDAAQAAKALAVNADAISGGGPDAKAALDATWADLRAMYEQLRLFGEAWNSLAERVGTA
ncbi:MAG: cupin domain-containing protein [Chloroflexota bacterium]|nr:cupin domain-containing protein [Chloroflexota bacterium]